MTAVHVVVPHGIDDPRHPSGGNTYDRKLCSGLTAIGWSVHEHAVPGAWPRADHVARARLTEVMAGIPDGALVLLDGLIASSVPEVLVPQARRARLVVLVHMPLGEAPHADGVVGASARERAVLTAAVAVVTTSAWTRHRLLRRYQLAPEAVHIAHPGVEIADLVTGTTTGTELLCVAAVLPLKGQDLLLTALAQVMDLPWHCRFVGDVNREQRFAEGLRLQASEQGIADRVRFTGPLTTDELHVAYAAADVLVLASRAETYCMVVTEALARGLPVVATAVGGLPEAFGQAADGSIPGMLVPPEDPAAFADALRGWLLDADLRDYLRAAARHRRGSLRGWSSTAARISSVLAAAAA